MNGQGNGESKPAEQMPQSMGTTDSTKTGFLAPPASGTPPSSLGGAGSGQAGMAAEASNAPTDVPSGIQPDTSAIAHTALPGEQASVHKVI